MKYRVGDEVLVRDCRAMEREFGVNRRGEIRCNKYAFVKTMRRFCGKKVTIVVVKTDCGFKNGCYGIEEGDWFFTDEMFAHNFSYGEEIEVSNGDFWLKRIFVSFVDGDSFPFVAIHEDFFRDRKRYRTENWKYARKIREPGIEIICRVYGNEVPLSTISEETLLSIRGEGR